MYVCKNPPRQSLKFGQGCIFECAMYVCSCYEKIFEYCNDTGSSHDFGMRTFFSYCLFSRRVRTQVVEIQAGVEDQVSHCS
jgi:hypothetical protein